jgi:hypothetical protein
MRSLISIAFLLTALALIFGWPPQGWSAPVPSATAWAQSSQTPAASPVDPSARAFRVTYVAADAVYLDGGTEAGLAEGTRLTVRRKVEGEALSAGDIIAEVEVFALTTTSAACEIVSEVLPIEEGDIAYMSAEERLEVLDAGGDDIAEGFAQTITFSDGDPLEEEIREYRPRPPLPEVNRVRGRIGFEHTSIVDRAGSGRRSHQEGVILRADMTRIGGTHWNFTGNWRGRLNARQSSAQDETLTDLVSRVYQIGLHYSNPDSRWVAGFGRLLLPWASSLETLDGGYAGRRIGTLTTVGAFAGTTPDPTAWNYDPDRQMLGAFANFDLGSFEKIRHISTAGVGITQLDGNPERRFLFLENNLQYGLNVSVHHNLEADYHSRGRFQSSSTGPVASRSFLTFRVQPNERVTFNLNHNFFRILPTFDPRLVGTGLVDDLLFQGLSGGLRFRVLQSVTLYTNIGRSDRDDDREASLNQMYGMTLSRLPWQGWRVDARYSLFDGPFGSGTYRAVSVSRTGDRMRVEVQLADQLLRARLETGRSRYVNADVDWFAGRHLILGGRVSVYRGDLQSYDQLSFNISYRFFSGRNAP